MRQARVTAAPQTEAVATAPRPIEVDPYTEEVRVAMALNGGVSLAVWMGGCAVELDCARRAHLCSEELMVPRPAPAQPGRAARLKAYLWDEPAAAPVAPSTTAPKRRVYHALCVAFRRELVIDIMSGASAGGINGALLAGAIRARTRLHPDFLRSKWLELGDFSKLLHRTSNAHPRSLMQGQKFFDDVLTAFRAVLREPGAVDDDLAHTALPSGQDGLTALDAKLDVTTTNIAGERRRFADAWGRDFYAREHRARFRFREHDDFTALNLATAARSSASFPLAFEPWLVADEAPLGLADFQRKRWVVDGGLLDNAPIRAALDLIPGRSAGRQVRRFVCYVNADPPAEAPDTDAGDPTLQDVVGYIINLPRNAPFVEQLYAVERAVQRGRFAAAAELELLALSLEPLEETARALLPPYRSRRRLGSLELYLQPVDTAAAFARLGILELPWVPTSLTPPTGAAWGWGVLAAQRLLHLLVDLIRRAPRRTVPGHRKLLEARSEIDRELGELEALRGELQDDTAVLGCLRKIAADENPSAEIGALRELMADYDPRIAACVRRGAETIFSVSTQLGQLDQNTVGEALFGADWGDAETLDDALYERFLRRVLAIEVIRRAFFADDDIDSSQALQFAQLTPFAPGRIFTAKPSSETGPSSPRAKLTGIGLGHFSGFYRRSWRANDFMWGRLDAAARVVDMLVDPRRAAQLEWLGTGQHPWQVLADRLLPEDATLEERWLIHEALGEPDGDAVPDRATLHPALLRALEVDLCSRDGSLTRVVCTRAAQLEILEHELPALDVASAWDTRIGASTRPLALPLENGLKPAIEELRTNPPLPARLGSGDRNELASNLAVRTMTHAALVGVGAVREAKVPFAPALQAVRALLLPVAGVVSRVPAYRFGVLAGFWAAATYLAVRLITTERVSAELGLLWSKPVLVAALALLAVLGVALVPLMRLLLGTRPARRIEEGVWALALLGTGGGVGVVFAVMEGDLGFAQVLVGPGAAAPPDWVLWWALVVIAGLSAVRIPLIQDRLDPLLAKPWSGLTSLALVLSVAGLVGGWSVGEALAAVADGPGWARITALLALGPAPFVAFLYMFVRAPLGRFGEWARARRRRREEREAAGAAVRAR